MDVTLVTYGIKRRIRPAAGSLDLRVNCLGLRDPHGVKALRDLSPLDERSRGYVRGTPGYAGWVKLQISKILVTMAMKNGGTISEGIACRVGVFCGWGINRSPTVASDIRHDLEMLGHKVRTVHYG